jgi:hypothetical protein
MESFAEIQQLSKQFDGPIDDMQKEAAFRDCMRR